MSLVKVINRTKVEEEKNTAVYVYCSRWFAALQDCNQTIIRKDLKMRKNKSRGVKVWAKMVRCSDALPRCQVLQYSVYFSRGSCLPVGTLAACVTSEWDRCHWAAASSSELQRLKKLNGDYECVQFLNRNLRRFSTHKSERARSFMIQCLWFYLRYIIINLLHSRLCING